jgi:CubicO group peptidase (beta-lactamase class C family)
MTRALSLTILCVMTVAGPSNLAAQTRRGEKPNVPGFADSERRAKLARAFRDVDLLFKDFAERSHVPGLAYGIVIDGELAHTGAIGYREVASRSPVDADTVFRIASMTKSFTALAILDLRDEGKLSLDDAVERYVPELRNLSYPSADSPRITIRHLLAHAEGFPEDNPWGDRQLAVTEDQMTAMLRRGIPFSNPPGLAYEYSNYGFAILGRIVSRVSRMSYRDYVEVNIIRPLRLAATTLDPSSVPPARLAHGYRWRDKWEEEPLLGDGAFGAMGGMLMSLRDLSRYVSFLMSAWPPRDDADDGPIRRASLREMQQVQRTAPATVTRSGPNAEIQLVAGGYGFGLRVWQSCDVRHTVAHTGGLPGFGSSMRWLPEHGVGVVTLANLTYTSAAAIGLQALQAMARTGALQPRIVQPSAALVEARDAVSRLIREWDDRVADSIAADDLFLDESKESRRRRLENLRQQHGICMPDGSFDVENALRGRWTMTCERGTLRAAITLAPTVPPKVQFLEVRPVNQSSESMSGAPCAQ